MYPMKNGTLTYNVTSITLILLHQLNYRKAVKLSIKIIKK